MEKELENLEKALTEHASAQIHYERVKEALELARATLAEQYEAVRVAQETLVWARVRLELARERLDVAKIMQETKHQGA